MIRLLIRFRLYRKNVGKEEVQNRKKKTNFNYSIALPADSLIYANCSSLSNSSRSYSVVFIYNVDVCERNEFNMFIGVERQVCVLE